MIDAPEKQKWQTILQRQKRANVERWLQRIQERGTSSDLVVQEYDNLLRALELVVSSPDDFDLAYRLIQALYPEVFGFADWDRWLVYLEQARTTSQQLNYLEEEANLAVQIGEVHYYCGNLEEAKLNYYQAQGIYEALQLLAKKANALSKLAVLYESQGPEGLALCQEALALAQIAQDEGVIADIQMNISHIWARMYEWEAGLQAAESAYVLYQKQNEQTKAVKAFFNMMTCWEKLGRWDEAEKASEQLRDVLTKMQDVHTLAKLKNNLGVMAFSQEKWDAAERNWQEALQLQSQLQNPAERAFLLNNLGLVYTQMGETAVAKTMLQQAITIQQALGDTFNWANAMDNLADLYLMMGDTAAARQVIRETVSPLSALDAPHARKLLADMQAKLP
jgi:tetratricopeptide (TPR) repeat protein